MEKHITTANVSQTAEEIAGLLVQAQSLIVKLVKEADSALHCDFLPNASAVVDPGGCIAIKTNIWAPKFGVYPLGGEKMRVSSIPTLSYSAVRQTWRTALIEAIKTIPYKTPEKSAVLIIHRHLASGHKIDPPNRENKIILDLLVGLKLIKDDSHKHLVLITAGEESTEQGTDIYIADIANIGTLLQRIS
jgi:hypothetical protein